MGLSRVFDSESEGYDDDFAERRAIDVTGRGICRKYFFNRDGAMGRRYLSRTVESEAI